MALSRIWAAFIIVSVIVAGARYLFSPPDRDIFGAMVIGKAGDTIRVAGATPATTVSPSPGSAVSPTPGTTIPPTVAPVSAPYKLQRSDGLIETCKAAVNLSLGLIGIMG